MSARKSRTQVRKEIEAQYEDRIVNLKAMVIELSNYRSSAERLIEQLRNANDQLEQAARSAPKPFSKIQAIKRVREALGIGLREAKEFVEAVTDDTVSIANGWDQPSVRPMTVTERKTRLLVGLQAQPSTPSNYESLRHIFLEEIDGMCSDHFKKLVELIDASRHS